MESQEIFEIKDEIKRNLILLSTLSYDIGFNYEQNEITEMEISQELIGALEYIHRISKSILQLNEQKVKEINQ